MRPDRRRNWVRDLWIGAALGAALIGSGSTAVLADEAISAREGDLECSACHSKPPRSRLNDRGMYYQAVGTLDGFEQLSASFGRCTHCHVRRPGSRKLTKSGKRFRRFVGDMKELREWLDTMHPPFGTDVGLSRPARDGGGDAVAIALDGS